MFRPPNQAPIRDPVRLRTELLTRWLPICGALRGGVDPGPVFRMARRRGLDQACERTLLGGEGEEVGCGWGGGDSEEIAGGDEYLLQGSTLVYTRSAARVEKIHLLSPSR